MHIFTSKDLVTLYYKIRNKLLLFINALWCLPLLVLIRILHPFYKVRLGYIDVSRIGHFTFAILFYQFSRSQHDKYLNLFSISDYVCNDFFLQIARRNLNIFSFAKYLYQWNKLLYEDEKYSVPKLSFNQLARRKPSNIEPWRFTDKENQEAQNWLRKNFQGEHRKIVCLIIRDSAYLSKNSNFNQKDFSYHNYRDTKIQSYLMAMEWLTEQGFLVFRMGKTMEERIKTKNKSIIDYAFIKDKNDFMDYWLFANCEFCISVGVGPDILTSIYNRPILFLNFLPLWNFWSHAKCMTTPKRLFWYSNENELTLKEYLLSNYSETDFYKRNGIKIIDLNEKEILESVKTFCNKFLFQKDDAIDVTEQEEFWKVVYSITNLENLHQWRNPECFIGPDWLSSIVRN